MNLEISEPLARVTLARFVELGELLVAYGESGTVQVPGFWWGGSRRAASDLQSTCQVLAGRWFLSSTNGDWVPTVIEPLPRTGVNWLSSTCSLGGP